MKAFFRLLGYLFIGIVVAILGCLISAFLALLFGGTTDTVATIYGWGIYFCFLIVACTGIIVKKINKS